MNTDQMLKQELDELKFTNTESNSVFSVADTRRGFEKPPRVSIQRQSQITKMVNEDLKAKTQALKDIEKVIFYEKQHPDIRNKVDFSERLSEIDKKIKLTQVELNSVVSGGKEIQLITPEQPSQIDVQPMNIWTVKIVTRRHHGPISIKIDQIAKFQGDLKINIHTHSKVSFDDYIW